ncbi:sugar-binding transcriptional regulator [Candidatus Enterococcus murrayae]|uniref:Sugar-binding transcriptional regulator n=1 Tax=Candidatus Enterococcus murrayae TaxID=2815321 RepID=A0ABS3HI66_9ENTE|nr:sugar-binding transcriptional regulator [Enterococcus sp. MJM16]MBO0452580.1 sugar-binding transcriptional regulator [Enterococcus sp. MJM16]
MEQDQLELMKIVTEKYYYQDINQAQIATELNLSKPTVSRLLKRAKKDGYIKVELNFPTTYHKSLGNQLASTFNLRKAFVYDTQLTNRHLIIEEMSNQISVFLDDLIQDNQTVGLAWGRTLHELSENIKGSKKKDTKVIQITGGAARNSMITNSEAIVLNFSRCYGSEWFQLPVPAFVDTKEIATALKKDRQIKNVLDSFDNLDVALFSVGEIHKNAIVVEAGYFGEEDFLDLLEKGVVGDIVGTFLDEDGKVLDLGLSQRHIGISAQQLKEVGNKVCVAIGEEKKNVLRAALRGGYIDYLFTDTVTAKEMLTQ